MYKYILVVGAGLIECMEIILPSIITFSGQ